MAGLSYLNVFRTHVWDRHVAYMARRSRDCGRSGAFLVAADESNGEIPVAEFAKFSHTTDFSHLGLPAIPSDCVLWWNADYPLFAIWRQYPNFDYYIMSEYDTFINCNLDHVIASCAERAVDLVVHELQPIHEGLHWTYPFVRELGADAWHALIPFTILSRGLIERLFQARRRLAERLRAGEIETWPYCEAFIPTIAKLHKLNIASVAEFVDTRYLRFRPFLNLRDDRLYEQECVAHPVLGGSRFVAAFSRARGGEGHVWTDGCLCPELEREAPEDIVEALGAVPPRFDPTDAPRPALLPAENDLAFGKPASQSSLCAWSHGKTIAEDAARANSFPLPSDYAFHTDHEEEAWWAVDLLRHVHVRAVEILNRPGYESRFVQFRIETSLDGATWRPQLEKHDNRGISSSPSRPAVLTFDEPALARHVRIVNLKPGFLHLRRVRVLAATSVCANLPPNVRVLSDAVRRESGRGTLTPLKVLSSG
jgi:hypothetical protein